MEDLRIGLTLAAGQHGGPGDHVHLRIVRRRRAHGDGVFIRAGNARVERVFDADFAGNQRPQDRAGLRAELGRLRPADLLDVIIEQIDRPAGGGDPAHAPPLGQASALKGQHGLHHVVEGGAGHDAVALAQRQKTLVIA